MRTAEPWRKSHPATSERKEKKRKEEEKKKKRKHVARSWAGAPGTEERSSDAFLRTSYPPKDASSHYATQDAVVWLQRSDGGDERLQCYKLQENVNEICIETSFFHPQRCRFITKTHEEVSNSKTELHIMFCGRLWGLRGLRLYLKIKIKKFMLLHRKQKFTI